MDIYKSKENFDAELVFFPTRFGSDKYKLNGLTKAEIEQARLVAIAKAKAAADEYARAVTEGKALVAADIEGKKKLKLAADAAAIRAAEAAAKAAIAKAKRLAEEKAARELKEYIDSLYQGSYKLSITSVKPNYDYSIFDGSDSKKNQVAPKR